jgi:hypothetical protein
MQRRGANLQQVHGRDDRSVSRLPFRNWSDWGTLRVTRADERPYAPPPKNSKRCTSDDRKKTVNFRGIDEIV